MMYRSIIIFYVSLLMVIVTGCKNDKKWELVWSDEFNEKGQPDETYWNYETGRKYNRELQYYTTDTANILIHDGILTITARLENDTITSGRINTSGKMGLLYGKVEVRAQIPTGLGTWPAIWMLGENIGETRWPACGEIDIMENVGYDPSKIHGTVHTRAYNSTKNSQKGNYIEADRPWEDYHLYSLEWYEDHLDFYFDDSLYFTFQNDMKGEHSTWPFDQPHFLILNFAFGGTWGGAQGVDSTALPLDFNIDYVKYYKEKEKSLKASAVAKALADSER